MTVLVMTHMSNTGHWDHRFLTAESAEHAEKSWFRSLCALCALCGGMWVITRDTPSILKKALDLAGKTRQ